MARAGFRAELRSTGTRGGHFVEVPGEVVQALGGKGRIAILATFNDIPYRGSIMRMGGLYMLGVTKGIKEQTGADTGDTLEVVVENDGALREVPVPAELAAAFKKDAGLRRTWDALSYTARKEHAASIEGAKKPETRARRVDQVLDALSS